MVATIVFKVYGNTYAYTSTKVDDDSIVTNYSIDGTRGHSIITQVEIQQFQMHTCMHLVAFQDN